MWTEISANGLLDSGNQSLLATLMVNVVGGLIVGVIQLWIEYNWFQTRPPVSTPGAAHKLRVVNSGNPLLVRAFVSMTLVLIIGSFVTFLAAPSTRTIEPLSLVMASGVYIGAGVMSLLVARNTSSCALGMSSWAGVLLGVVVALLYIFRLPANLMSPLWANIDNSVFFVLGLSCGFLVVPVVPRVAQGAFVGLLTFGLSVLAWIFLYNLLSPSLMQNSTIWFAWGAVVGMLVSAISYPELALRLLSGFGTDV